ncbi:MAG: hypothetical protein LBH40_02495 [Alphaproteobacteria bacterium]|jgi:hypothetical protein|nr:hypothetical protein [Alphaproteobacteria bacterium]
MNLIIKDISKQRAEEIVNELDKLIDESIIDDWTIDDTEEQDYRSTNTLLGDVSIKPYYRNKSLCFGIIGDYDKDIKSANITRFLELMLTYFSDDVKLIKIINL